MADRTVTAKLRADTSGYIPGVEAASKSTTGLALAQKEAAAAAKAGAQANAGFSSASVEAARTTRLLATAQREAAEAAKAAAVADTEATRALSAAQKEAAAAAKDTSVLGAERRAAAQQAVASAEKEAAAAAEAKTASAEQAKAARTAVIANRDQSASAREIATEETAAAKVSEEAAKKRSDAYTNTGKKMMVAGVVLAGAFVAAEKATSDFDKSLSGVQAVSSASAAEMDKLRAAALKAGADTSFTATEAANAEAELVKAGVSVADTLNGGLNGALSLAAAGQLDLADAATLSANAMNTFKLKGQDVAHIADVYAAAANKSAADVKELGYAMQQGGLVAAQTGLTFEDTTAVLAAFSDRALKGADGGTSLKTMLEKLNAPSKQAAGLMDALGITTYDTGGKFVGITTLAGELHDKLGPLTDATRNQALATIFGSDAIRAATILYNLGSDGVQGYKDAVNDSGAASRMASAQMDNLSGDLEQLKGSFETALIKGGSGATSALRGLTKEATGAVNAFSALPDWLQQSAVGFAGGSGSALLLVGGLTSIVGKAGATRKALTEVAEASKGLKGGLASAGAFAIGPWGLAIAGATAAISIFASKHHEAKIEVASFTDAIKEDGDALGNSTTKAVAADLASKGLFATYGKLGVSSATVTDAALGNADALKAVSDATEQAIKAGDHNSISGLKATQVMASNLFTVKSYKGALTDQLKAQQQTTAATQASTAATGTSELETTKATQAAKDAAAAAFSQTAGQRALTDAELGGAFATAATVEKKKAAAKGSRALSDAIRQQALDDRDSTSAQQAASDAADKHTVALYKTADSAKAAATAAAANSDANADNAKKTADEAEAAAEASDVHQLGAKWLREVADAEISASGSARDLDASVTDEVAAFKDAKDKASLLHDALDALNGVHIAASRAAIDVQDKVANLTKTLRENGTTLDITSDKGRANMGVVLDLAQAINGHAQAVAEESGSVEAGNKALDASRDEFDKVLKSAGLSKDQIQRFNDTLLNTPKLTNVKITADTSAAAAKLQALIDRFGYISVQVGGGSGGRAALATGGLVVGPGGPTSDSVPINASAGEYVVKAAAVARPGMKRVLDDLNFGSGHASVVKPLNALNASTSDATTIVPYVGGRSAAARSAIAAIEGRLQVEMVSSGTDEDLLRFLRKAVRVRGGDVQAVLGTGR
jgi:TP901 family phage tail tape measure protein